jgi:hypothetical protein
MSLEGTSYRLIVFRLISKTNLCLIARKSNRTLLISSHAARVEQASPEEDPIHNISIVTRLMSARRYLPIEKAQPKQQPLPLVDLNPVDPQPLLSNMLVLSICTRCTSQVSDEPDDGHAECRCHLQELVFDIFLLAQRAGLGALLLLHDEEDGGDGRQDGRVQQREREQFVWKWQEDGDER